MRNAFHTGEFERDDGTLHLWNHQGEFDSCQFIEKLCQVREKLLDDSIKQIKKVLNYLGEHREVLEEVQKRFNGTNVTKIAQETNLAYINVKYILGVVSDVYWKLPKIVRKDDTITAVGPPLASRLYEK